MRSLAVSLLLLSAAYSQIIFPGQETTDSVNPPSSPGGNGEEDIDELLYLTLNTTNRQTIGINSGASSTCSTPADETGTCGSLNQCPSYIPFIKQLNNPTVFKFFKERICRLLPRTVHLCCPFGNPVLPFGGSPLIPSDLECGLPGGERITGGQEVKPGFWPWLAALGLRTGRGNQFFTNCGGSLITRRHVLTAAHCFGQGDIPNLVRLGEHHLDHDNAGERPKEYSIVNHVSHSSYNRATVQNDIAILTLDQDVVYNDFIRPICLPFNYRANEFVNKELTVVGWGLTSFENRRTSKVPRQAQVPVVPRTRCKANYQEYNQQLVITSRQLCAGVGGQDACSGDSGGPLNYLDNLTGRYYLVGVVSYGIQCALADYPGVYTRVSSYLDWIEQNLN